MVRAHQANLEIIKYVAKRLGPLRERVAFLGGSATGLLITDSAAPEVRATRDVDVIVEIASRSDYYRLEKTLRGLGFIQDMDENAPICRWIIDGVRVDVMPTDEKILGFANRWNSPAIRTATKIELEAELEILLVTGPYFLATKIEAFYGRGKGDYRVSHDMEDIITVLDGRREIIDEIKVSSGDLKAFLAGTFQSFLNDQSFLESLSGHLLPDPASQERLPALMARIRVVAQIT